MNLSLGMVQVRTTGPPKSPARNQNGLLLFWFCAQFGPVVSSIGLVDAGICNTHLAHWALITGMTEEGIIDVAVVVEVDGDGDNEDDGDNEEVYLI